MKDFLKAAGAAFLIGTAGCDNKPTVEECRVVMKEADAKANEELAEKTAATGEKAMSAIAEKPAATGEKAMSAIAEKPADERSPQEDHDLRMRMIKSLELSGSSKLQHIAEIQEQVRQGNTLYTNEEKVEMSGLIISILITDPLSATQYYGGGAKLFGIDPLATVIERVGSTPLTKKILDPKKADGNQNGELVFNAVKKVKEKAKEMRMPIDTDEVQKSADAYLQASAQKLLDPKTVDGDQYDNFSFDYLGRTIQSAREAGFKVDMASLQPLADAYLQASAQKLLDPKTVDGGRYDNLPFYHIGRTIQSARGAGFKVDMASLQPLATVYLTKHKRKAPELDLSWEQLKEAAQTAGFTVAE